MQSTWLAVSTTWLRALSTKPQLFMITMHTFNPGHGAAWDFESTNLVSLLEDMVKDGKVIGALAHGVVGLVNVLRPDATNVLKGTCVTGFSNEEEELVEREKVSFFFSPFRGGEGQIYQAYLFLSAPPAGTLLS